MEKVDLKPSLYGLEKKEIEEIIKAKGLPAYRAAQVFDWIYQKNILAFSELKNLPPAMVAEIQKEYDLKTLELMEVSNSVDRESTKFLFKTRDSQLIESVLIEQSGRRTVCVSTQVGCKIGCAFCASGKGKFGRNLEPGEIIEQVAQIQRNNQKKVTNIVYMGMGEPLDNFDATMKSLKLLQDPEAFGIGARRITVSTSGITPRVVEFVKRSEGRVRLSISLHSSNDETRTKLVPINKKYHLRELLTALNAIHEDLTREITFEYTLIAGVNDDAGEAEGVAKIAKPLQAKVNLIPYNPIEESDYKTPSKETIDKFAAILEKRGIRVIVRQTAGRDINAACGQLARIRTA